MSLRFCTHPWEVTDLEDGTLVALTQRDLDPETVAILVDDLHELVLESGRPNLYLDLGRVGMLATVVMGKLVSLNKKLDAHGGKLIVGNIEPELYRHLQLTHITEMLDVRRELDVA